MIRVENFWKYYGAEPVLRDVSMEAQKGELLVVIGRSGCGKSTLLRHVAGLENDESGEVQGKITLFGDQTITSMSEAQVRRARLRGPRLGLVFQHSALFDSMTARENILWAVEETLRLDDVAQAERLREVCAMAEIPVDDGLLDRDAPRLSGGERKRVALARALALKPEAILFDEPTTGLDPPTAAEVSRTIRRLRDEHGLTAVVTTHDMGTARALADRVVMLKDGRKVFEGSLQDAAADTAMRKFMGTE